MDVTGYRDFLDKTIADLKNFAKENFSKDHINQAWACFCVWEEDQVDDSHADIGLFWCWYLLHWKPYCLGSDKESLTVLEVYKKEKAASLSPEDLQILDSMAKALPDIYRVIAVKSDGVLLKRLLTEEKLQVSLSHNRCDHLKEGVFIFGMVVENKTFGHHMLTRGCKPLQKEQLDSFVSELSSIENLDYKSDYNLIQSEYLELYYDMKSP